MNKWVLLEHKVYSANSTDLHYDFLVENGIDCLTWKFLKLPLLNQDSIPHYVKMDWTSSAYLVEAASLPNQVIRIFVPKEHLKKASSIADAILGINK